MGGFTGTKRDRKTVWRDEFCTSNEALTRGGAVGNWRGPVKPGRTSGKDDAKKSSAGSGAESESGGTGGAGAGAGKDEGAGGAEGERYRGKDRLEEDGAAVDGELTPGCVRRVARRTSPGAIFAASRRG